MPHPALQRASARPGEPSGDAFRASAPFRSVNPAVSVHVPLRLGKGLQPICPRVQFVGEIPQLVRDFIVRKAECMLPEASCAGSQGRGSLFGLV